MFVNSTTFREPATAFTNAVEDLMAHLVEYGSDRIKSGHCLQHVWRAFFAWRVGIAVRVAQGICSDAHGSYRHCWLELDGTCIDLVTAEAPPATDYYRRYGVTDVQTYSPAEVDAEMRLHNTITFWRHLQEPGPAS